MKKPLHPLTLWISAILLAVGVVALDNAWVALAIVGAVALLVEQMHTKK